jgi:hypothetical protein
MKKFAILFLALLIAVPAVTYAGSATSRWDLTIGGYVKMDVGYVTQGQGADYRAASRGSIPGSQNVTDEYANLFWSGGETRLNFAIKGPDGMGAKTAAFVEGDFRGTTGGSTTDGTFGLRHAFMTFDWANNQLLLGHTWQPWGLIPSFQILAFSENHFFKGATRVPQVRYTQKFTKEFTAVFAASSPDSTQALNSGYAAGAAANGVSDQTRSLVPDVSLEFKYATDKCGKIGPWMLQFGLAGMAGKEKHTYITAGAAQDTSVNRWGASFWGYIPIIPDKKGNKAGALGLTGNVFAGQGLGIYLPAYPGGGLTGSYDTTNTNQFGGYPTAFGAWTQLTYYFTDQFFANALYGFQQNNYSDAYSNTINPAILTTSTYANGVKNLQNYVFNVMYDVNPAVRFGLEYTYVTTAYAGYNAAVPASDTKGSFQAVRFGAYYFF